MTNEAYVNRNFHGIVVIGLIAMVIFAAKGFATYGSTVTLSSIGNRIIADNQRRLFDKLLRENIGFFADRHSSEFIARLTTGAAAVSGVINLLITAIGRDLMSLIGLVIVMVIQDPVMSLFGFIGGAAGVLLSAQGDPPGARHRPHAVHRRHAASSRPCRKRCRACAWSRRSASRTRCGGGSIRASRRSSTSSNKMARVANRASPIMEMLGGFTIALATIYGGYRVIETGATPGPVRFFHGRVPARL